MVFSMCMSISLAGNQSGTVSNTSSASATDTPAPTDTPTDTPVPTLSPAQVEKVYKASTSSTTVINLDKEGNNDKGKDVHFTCQILKLVKDDSGNTAGANVVTPNSYSSSQSFVWKHYRSQLPLMRPSHAVFEDWLESS